MALTRFRVHIIHTGTMDNRGTQALLTSDVGLIRDITAGAVDVSVSTSDILGVQKLRLDLAAVVSPMLDIPFQKADVFSRKHNFRRTTPQYWVLSLGCFMFMLVQMWLSAFSVSFSKVKGKPLYRGVSVKQLMNSDLVVSYSDENFREASSLLPVNPVWILSWWSMIVARTWEILVARFYGKPVIMFPNSIGPFKTSIGRHIAKSALNACSCIIARDSISFEMLKSIETKATTLLASDTALLFKTSKTAREAPAAPKIGVCPGIYGYTLSQNEVEQYVESHARALDDGIEKHGFKVLFLPNFVADSAGDDLEMCRRIAEKMTNAGMVRILNTEDVSEFKCMLDMMDMVVSSKMHPAVLAASGHVPILCVSYDQKQIGFFESLGLLDCTLGVCDLTYHKLSKKMEYVWSKRDSIRKQLRERVPRLQESIRMSAYKAVKPFFLRKGRKGN